MFKQLRKANQNDYLLITATLILLVVFSLSLLSYVQGQQKAAERRPGPGVRRCDSGPNRRPGAAESRPGLVGGRRHTLLRRPF